MQHCVNRLAADTLLTTRKSVLHHLSTSISSYWQRNRANTVEWSKCITCNASVFRDLNLCAYAKIREQSEKWILRQFLCSDKKIWRAQQYNQCASSRLQHICRCESRIQWIRRNVSRSWSRYDSNFKILKHSHLESGLVNNLTNTKNFH